MDPKPTTARKLTRSTKDDLARQAQDAEIAGAVVIPALTDDEALEARGIEVTQRATAAYMVAAEVYHAIYVERLWERRGRAIKCGEWNKRSRAR